MQKLTRNYSSANFLPQNPSCKPTNTTAKTSYKENKIDDFYNPFRGQHPTKKKKLHDGSFEINLTIKPKK